MTYVHDRQGLAVSCPSCRQVRNPRTSSSSNSYYRAVYTRRIHSTCRYSEKCAAGTHRGHRNARYKEHERDNRAVRRAHRALGLQVTYRIFCSGYGSDRVPNMQRLYCVYRGLYIGRTSVLSLSLRSRSPSSKRASRSVQISSTKATTVSIVR